MKHILKLISATAVILSLVTPELFAAAGTTGTPLGGLGASYIVYNAAKNIFVKGYRLSGQHWYDEVRFDASFNLYTKVDGNVKTTTNMESPREDALIPIYNVDYDIVNNIEVDLLAFGPYVSGDEKSSVMPLAFFEFVVKNGNAKAAEAAIAFKISGLAGANPKKIDGIDGVYFDTTAIKPDNSAFAGASDIPNAEITTGSSLDQFLASGKLTGPHGGIVAVKLNLEASQTGRIRFVVGWYQEFVDKNWKDSIVDEGFRYQNDTIGIKSSIDAVKYGLSEFVRIRDGASDFANSIMGIKELPHWYKDRLLNNLYPLTHNSQYARDGRFAWREGKYYILGTIDQQGHSQIATSYNWPEGQWRQMWYWGRTQRQGAYEGQIHHDFNGPKSGSDKVNALCGWDEYGHRDYWWSKTENWSDLNSLFIINVYELFLATGDTTWLNRLWPHMQKTAARILYQAKRCVHNVYLAPPAPYDSNNFVLPYSCLGSYDREGATNEYNGSLALVAYASLAEMCRTRGEIEEAKKWDEIFERGKKQFSTLYSSKSDYATQVEGQLGVYNFSRHLGLPVMMSDDEANKAFDRYWDRSNKGRDLLPWHFYTINHFGDFGIAIGRVDDGLKVHLTDWETHCNRYPNYYFWQDLDQSPGMHSYMTAPVVWRSYLLISGFVMDKFNQRLWLRPMLPSEANGKLTDAPLISPGNWGNLNYEETGKGLTQKLGISFKEDMMVKEIRLKNVGGVENDIRVVMGGRSVPHKVSYSGQGLDAIIKIELDHPVAINSDDNLLIGVNRDDVGINNRLRNGRFSDHLSVRSLNNRQIIDYSVEKKGKTALAVYLANGVLVKNFDLGMRNSGRFSQVIDNLSTGFYYLRLMQDGKCVSTSSMVITK